MPTNTAVHKEPGYQLGPFAKILESSRASPWECVYFVRGGYIGAPCPNQGKPIKFMVYFVDGAELRSSKSLLKDTCSHELSLNDIYPVFEIKHPDCILLSKDITEGCLEKIQQQEQEHYKLHKDDLEPFSRLQHGLDIFCFLMDTLPIPITATPIVEDPSALISNSLLDLRLASNDDEDSLLESIDVIKRLLAQTDAKRYI